MALLTDAMQEMIKQHQCFVATADKAGRPNVGPKRSTQVLDDSTLMFAEATGKKTFQNLQENPQVAIAVVDREKMDGYRFVGTATIHTSGEIYDRVAAQMQKAGIKAQAVVTVQVEEIYSLKPGQAGERIA